MRLILSLLMAVACYGQAVTSSPAPVQDAASSTTAQAVPSKALYIGGVQAGNLVGMTICNLTASLQMTTATTTQIIALSGTTSIHVCSYQIQGSTTSTATTLKLVAGTGTNCGTVTATETPAWNMAASSSTVQNIGTWGQLFVAPSGSALCGTNSAAGTVNIEVSYTQY